MTTDLVFNENGKTLTNSLLVAKTFGKEHRRVTQDIRNLACSDNFRLHNFVQTTYTSYLDSIRKILATAENSAVLSDGRNLPSSELVKVVN